MEPTTLQTVGIVAGVFTGALPWAIPKAWHYLTITRPIRLFWDPICKDRGVSVITTAGMWQSQSNSQFCDFIATIKAGMFFQANYAGRYHLYTCEDNAPDMLTRSLVLIGGPLPNSVTKHVFDRVTVRYTFRNHDIIDDSNGNVVRQSRREGDHITEDFGVVTKCVNPFNADATVMVAAGMHGWGTQAALEALLDRKNVRFLSAQDVDCYQVLVSVAVHERHCGMPVLHTDSFVKLHR